jgi:hypothetical protein
MHAATAGNSAVAAGEGGGAQLVNFTHIFWRAF